MSLVVVYSGLRDPQGVFLSIPGELRVVMSVEEDPLHLRLSVSQSLATVPVWSSVPRRSSAYERDVVPAATAKNRKSEVAAATSVWLVVIVAKISSRNRTHRMNVY